MSLSAISASTSALAMGLCMCVCDSMLIRHPSLSQFQTDPLEICESSSSQCSACICSVLGSEPLVKGQPIAAGPAPLGASASLHLEAS